MENNIITKTNDLFGVLRIVMMDREPWFVGKDVAEKLGYAEPNKSITRHVDEDDRTKHPIIDSVGRTQESWIINESGLYSLISKSETKSKEYKDSFKNWLVSEGLIEEDSFYNVGLVMKGIMSN